MFGILYSSVEHMIKKSKIEIRIETENIKMSNRSNTLKNRNRLLSQIVFCMFIF